MKMNEFDLDVRLAVYRHFVSANRAPGAHELAKVLNSEVDLIYQSFARLADEHVLVIDPESLEIRMAMPFSATPTAYKVTVEQNTWWAN